jgi:uncharacterized membrane protein YoaK (UPF0700 family)
MAEILHIFAGPKHQLRLPKTIRQILREALLMFRQGKPRAFIHNLRLASMLSFVAGIVNISGVLSIQTLTTNVTGHFAFFAEEFVKGDYTTAVAYIRFIFAFLFGAFSCNFCVEVMLKKKLAWPHATPIIIEVMILSAVAVTVSGRVNDQWIACSLLFAMGLQNALVTKVSQATVRTTHLTGLFTDLGIEVSQLFFYRETTERRKLSSSIYLRLAIIGFFFLGCVLGGFLFNDLQLYTLFFAATVLVIALIYDGLLLGYHNYRRSLKSRHTTS